MGFNSIFGLGSHPPDAALKGHWPLQETSGTTASDRSGSSYHGTINGGATLGVTGPNAWIANAIDFDGTDDHIALGDLKAGFTDEVTIGAWVKADTAANFGQIVSAFLGSGAQGFELRLNGTTGQPQFVVGIKQIPSDTSTVGAWSFTCGAYSDTTTDEVLYDDGARKRVGLTGTIPFGAVSWTIGSRPNGSLDFDGQIANVFLLNRAISDAEEEEIRLGPEPENLTAPVLATDGTVTSGTWGLPAPHASGSNGTITRTTYLHLASDDSLVATLYTANPDFSSYVTSGLTYYVVERAANDGGYDAAEDTASADVLIGGGGGGGVTATPSTAALTLTAYAPDVTATDAKTVTPTTAALTLTAYAPSVTAAAHVTAEPSTAALTLTAYAPDVTAGGAVTVTPTTASLTLATFAPTVIAGGSVTVTPSTSAITLASYAPDVIASGAVAVTPTTTAVVLTAYAPDVTAGASLTITPSAATLVLAGLAPTVTGGAGVTVTPVPATLSLVTYAADIVTPVAVTPTPVALTITTYAPSLGGQRSAAYLYYLLNN